MENKPLRYALLTAARNEEAFIEKTILSVIAQTAQPVTWIIASDGSTDRTDEIIKAYAARHSWIEFVRMPERRDRQFAAKAHCINASYRRIENLNFEVVANIDADVSFDADYCEFLLGKFKLISGLGVAGTPYVETNSHSTAETSAHSLTDLNHVSGQCQFFRRSCFEEIGGYVPIKGGAIDWVAVTTARMKGWITRSFTAKKFLHHRQMGTAEQSILSARFHYGCKAYYVGGHPVWEMLRGICQMKQRPWIVGGLFFQLGYILAGLKRMPRAVSQELMAFHRAEQMNRLRKIFKRAAKSQAVPSH